MHIRGIFVLSHLFFPWFYGCFWYFYIEFLIFFSKILLALAHYALVNGWCPCHLSDVCDSTLWPNLTFRCVFKSTIMSSFSWYNTWQCLMIELSLVVISSPPSFLSHATKGALLFSSFFTFQFQFQSSFFYLLFCSYFFCKSLIYFEFSLSITICYFVLIFFHGLIVLH